MARQSLGPRGLSDAALGARLCFSFLVVDAPSQSLRLHSLLGMVGESAHIDAEVLALKVPTIYT